MKWTIFRTRKKMTIKLYINVCCVVCQQTILFINTVLVFFNESISIQTIRRIRWATTQFLFFNVPLTIGVLLTVFFFLCIASKYSTSTSSSSFICCEIRISYHRKNWTNVLVTGNSLHNSMMKFWVCHSRWKLVILSTIYLTLFFLTHGQNNDLIIIEFSEFSIATRLRHLPTNYVGIEF